MTALSSSLPLLANRTITGPASARLVIDGRAYINFFGAGYLALSSVPEVRAAVAWALEQGVPFAQHIPTALGGIDPLFESVERAGARACDTETSVYFGSGYLIGAVALASLPEPCDWVLIDEHAHYNLKDAAKQSGLPTFMIAHCDAESLADALRRHGGSGNRPLLLTDGIFPTTGRLPPLAEYARILEAYRGHLVIDESHAFGVIGERGRGAAEYCGLRHGFTAASTLSKAYCAHGAILGCSAERAQRVRMLPPLRGTNAGSPLSAAAAAASLDYVGGRPELRASLHEMADYLRLRLRSLGFDVMDSPAPIVSFGWGKRADMEALQRRVFERGIYIYHSSYIGAGADGLIRCAVFRDHSKQDIDALIGALN